MKDKVASVKTVATVAIVTGGGRGIGRAVCQRLAADGCQVVAASRTLEELEETKGLVETAGGRCIIRQADLADCDDIASLVDTTVERCGQVDVLVNCAGVAPKATLDDMTPALFEVIMAVNVFAVYHACRAVWPIMSKRGAGVIVNVSSAASVDPFPGFSAYGASKAWVNTWTKGLAEEGRSCGVSVFAVAPGAVETRMLRDVFPDYPKDQTLNPSDVADVVHALIQPGCRYATGQTVFIRK